jgi:hypothetical protein
MDFGSLLGHVGPDDRLGNRNTDSQEAMPMEGRFSLGCAAIAVLLVGCQSQQQMVDEMKADATQVAQRRGAFELNCPAATASVLSNEMVQSAITNPRWAPPQRAEYTVGVSGCNQRATYLVVCAEGGTGCVAAGAQNITRADVSSPAAR